MSLSYTTSPHLYVDSQNGTGSAGHMKANVPVIYDTMYHRKAQEKVWWRQKGMIGEASYAAGSIEQTSNALPVMRLTDFQGKKGDTLVLHQEEPIASTVNSGIAGGFQMVDNEVGWDSNYQKVQIEQWRQAVRTDSGISEQRMPYNISPVQLEMEKLSDWTGVVFDTGLSYIMHYGYAPHQFRFTDTTNCPPTANYHTLYGNDKTFDLTRTIANMDSNTDALSPETFDIAYTYAQQALFDFVTVDGDNFLIALVSPKGMMALRSSDGFKNAAYYAAERGSQNPIFRNSGGLVFGNCLIFTYDKIRSLIAGKNPAGLTVTNGGAYNSQIVEADFTGVGSGLTASTQLHQTYFLGARAIILAEGRLKMGERTENDYGQIIGRDADNIWGGKRNNWLTPAAAADNYSNILRIVNSI